MTRRKSHKSKKPLKEANSDVNTLQINKVLAQSSVKKPVVDETYCKPSTSTAFDSLDTNTSALYDELDSFRQRWKRELVETKQNDSSSSDKNLQSGDQVSDKSKGITKQSKETVTASQVEKNSIDATNDEEQIDSNYAKARNLFLIAVDLEHDEMHHESIMYYKQAMHLYPDIEKRIFLEQCEASAKENALQQSSKSDESKGWREEDEDELKIPLYDRIRDSFYEANKDGNYRACKPRNTVKSSSIHLSDLPYEIIMKIFHYIVGEELDLASLESTGLTCKGFYLISKDPVLWRNICFNTWRGATMNSISKDFTDSKVSIGEPNQIDWEQMYLDRPRINFDGVYISRTRYIRQGDIGFQDITYRPFHVVRYYRYLRFFPDRRVLILTTNEEPDKIVPIFRHALHSKQFSSELSILEGVFEFVGTNQINIMAERDCTTSTHQRRQPQYWSRQTPLSQKLNLKFELKTSKSKPFKNNVLRWLEYKLTTRLETGSEVESFDIAPDLFPNLIFSRVRKFNLKSSNPLSSHW